MKGLNVRAHRPIATRPLEGLKAFQGEPALTSPAPPTQAGVEHRRAHLEGASPVLRATTVTSPVCMSLTATSLLGLWLLRNCAAPIAVSLVSRYERGTPSTRTSNIAPSALSANSAFQEDKYPGIKIESVPEAGDTIALAAGSFMLQGSPRTPLGPLPSCLFVNRRWIGTCEDARPFAESQIRGHNN